MSESVWRCEGYLLHNTGICKGHMAYFDNQEDRANWFKSKQISNGHFEQYSYIRPDKQTINGYVTGCCHVALPYNNLTECDYVMFKNNDIDNKRWFYGSITKREYVNVNSTRLWFDIDYYSTYADVLKIGACFVERNHVTVYDDWQGSSIPSYKYLNPEPITVRTKRCYWDWNDPYFYNWFEDNCRPTGYLLYATTDEIGNTNYDITFRGNAPTAMYTRFCPTFKELEEAVQEYLKSNFFFGDESRVENILMIQWLPEALARMGDSYQPYNSFGTNFKDTSVPLKGFLKRSDGNPVQNAKCYTYPYLFVTAKSPNGEQLIIKFEEYSHEGGYIRHWISGGGTVDACFRYSVTLPDCAEYNSMKFLKLPCYPQIAINSDTFSRWAATNGGTSLVKGMTSAAMVALGSVAMATPGLEVMGGGMIASGIGGAIGETVNIVEQSQLPDTEVGASTGSTIGAWDMYRIGFEINKPSIEDVTSLDDYFNAYGYNLSRFMIPKLKVRKYWTYVKTKNSQVTGSCPYEAIDYTQNLLNSGTTFWNVKNCEIGEYRFDNPDA